jgi:aminoglycoside 3-N-acetyltransferase
MNIKKKTEIIETLAKNWNKSGLEKGDLVLVHASLERLTRAVEKKFGEMVTPQMVYDSLLMAIGEEGTLMLPQFNFDFGETKFFDIRETPSQMGDLTEIGRKDPKAIRTGHPAYSFSVRGKLAHEFEGIDNESGYGKDSPFAKLHELGGKIAMIGLKDRNSQTSSHYVEEEMQVDFRCYKEFPGVYVDKDGNMSQRTYRLYVRDTENGVEQTENDNQMDYYWNEGGYKGDKWDEGYGMRTIAFDDLYRLTKKIINEGLAPTHLYKRKEE